MKTDGKDTKTAEERARTLVHDIFIIGNNWDSVDTVVQELKAHAADARREALQEAANVVRNNEHEDYGAHEDYLAFVIESLMGNADTNSETDLDELDHYMQYGDK